MFESQNVVCCDESPMLVFIETIPLCCLKTEESATVLETIAEAVAFHFDSPSLSTGVPMRCIAAMSCSEALTLVQEVGHVLL